LQRIGGSDEEGVRPERDEIERERGDLRDD